MIDTGNLRPSEASQNAEQTKFYMVTSSKESFAGKFDTLCILEMAEPIPIKNGLVITLSQLVDQIPRADSKSLSHPQERMQANPLLAAFHFPYINRMQIGLFGQSLLAHSGLFSAIANGITQDFELSRTRHSLLGKHGRVKTRTPNMGLFYPCVLLKMA